ncbi:hypothetical protein VTK56DRAFT_1909 [Thermocarpiscus australiensis]
MIGRAGPGCRSCAAHARQLRWPVQARESNLLRRSSTSSASSAGNATTESASSANPDYVISYYYYSRGGKIPQKVTRAAEQARAARVAREARDASETRETRDVPISYVPYSKPPTRADKRFRELAQDWQRGFSEAWSRTESPGLKDPARPVMNAGVEELAKLLPLSSVAEMREYWKAQPEHTREYVWPDIMLAALNFAPNRVGQLLEATVEQDVTAPYAVADLLKFLVMWSSKLPADRRQEQQAALPGLLLHCLRATYPEHIKLEQWTIYKMIPFCKSLETLAEIYTELRQYGQFLHVNTRLQFARRFAEDPNHKLLALGILEEIVNAGKINPNDPRCAALTTAILTFPDKGRSSLTTNYLQFLNQLIPQVYERVLQLGVTPNLITYTAIIRSLCLTQQLPTAWRIYNFMREQGIEPDSYVYSTLLNGSKLAIDLESASRVVHEASAETLRDPMIWTDLLHTSLFAALKEARDKELKPPRALPAFPSMLRIYARFFKLEPLQEIIPSNLHDHLTASALDVGAVGWESMAYMEDIAHKLPVSEEHELVEPSGITLLIMVLGYIKGFSNVYNIITFYSHFRSLVKTGNEVAADLVRQGTFVYDAIIKAVTEWSGMQRLALDILRDMLEDAAAAAAAAGPSSSSDQTTKHTPDTSRPTPTSLHRAPSVYTWSVLLHGFFQQGQTRQAERILHMMRQRGIEPNLVTWNTLVAGYARAQYMGKTVSTLAEMEDAGHQADYWTSRAFSHLGNQQRALELLERRQQLSRGERVSDEEAEVAAAAAAERGAVPQEGPVAPSSLELQDGKPLAPEEVELREEFMKMRDELEDGKARSPPEVELREESMKMPDGLEDEKPRPPEETELREEFSKMRDELEEIGKDMSEEMILEGWERILEDPGQPAGGKRGR